MAMSIGRYEGQPACEINMTPLIDVMLVLLIIFIITIPIQTNAVKIDNPTSAKNVHAAPAETINLSIDFDGTVFWNGRALDRIDWQRNIDASAVQVPQPEMHIAVDKFARYEAVAQILAELQHRGLKRISFLSGALY